MNHIPLIMRWSDYFPWMPTDNPKKYRYPRAAISFDVAGFLIYTSRLTAAKAGQLTCMLFDAAMNGDWAYLEQFDFIARVYNGTAKRESIPPSVRKAVKSIGACALCATTEKLTVDHIIPVSKGGGNDIKNLQCLCFSCNVKKSNKL